MYGDDLNYPIIQGIIRYHLDIPTVPRETLSMQEMADGDNNRTPVVFRPPDNCNIVGANRRLESGVS